LTLIEFSDYQCPFCARHTKETHPQLVKEYIDTGKLRYVFFDFPLESIHKQAFKAAEATRCAGDQGKYWEMHELLFASQKSLEPWSKHAEALGLDATAFDACMTGGTHASAVRADIEVAKKLGMTGTPGFLIAQTDPKDPQKVKGLTLLKGAKSFDAFKTDIEKALGSEAAK
jgi:protein-disulfide isomerase